MVLEDAQGEHDPTDDELGVIVFKCDIPDVDVEWSKGRGNRNRNRNRKVGARRGGRASGDGRRWQNGKFPWGGRERGCKNGVGIRDAKKPKVDGYGRDASDLPLSLGFSREKK